MSHTDVRELPESVVRMQGIRRSNASGIHKDARLSRLRTRSTSKSAAIRESMG